MSKPTRRQFLATSSTAVIGSGLSASMVPNVHVHGREEIRVALVGCGGRGTGAVAQIFNTKGVTRLVAVADVFEQKAKNAVKNLTKHAEAKVDVPDERVFSGMDAFKKAIDSDCDLVVIATPPGPKGPYTGKPSRDQPICGEWPSDSAPIWVSRHDAGKW